MGCDIKTFFSLKTHQKLLDDFLYLDLSGAENPFFLPFNEGTMGGSVGVCEGFLVPYCGIQWPCDTCLLFDIGTGSRDGLPLSTISHDTSSLSTEQF